MRNRPHKVMLLTRPTAMLILFEGRSSDGSVMFMTKAQLSPFGQAILGPDGSEPVHAEWLDSDYLFVRLDNGGHDHFPRWFDHCLGRRR